MAKKKIIPPKYQIWINAKKDFKLSNVQIQMARELGLNPKRFGKLANHKQERWKLPLPEFIEKIYFKRFKKKQPDKVISMEQCVKDYNRKRNQRREENKKRKRDAKKAVPYAATIGKCLIATEIIQNN